MTGTIGFTAGIGSGLFGIGGGSIRIPLLSFMGISLISAFGINLLSLPITSSMGAFTQRKNINYRIGAFMVLGGTVGTIIGTAIAFSLATSSFWLAIIFLFASLVAVLALNIKHNETDVSEVHDPTIQAVTSGTCVCNILTGMRGGTEGSLFVPLLKALNVDTHKAIGTSLFAAVFTSIVGVLLYWNQGYIILQQGIAVVIGSIIGAKLGSNISLQTKPKWLEFGLSILILILAVATFLNAAFL